MCAWPSSQSPESSRSSRSRWRTAPTRARTTAAPAAGSRPGVNLRVAVALATVYVVWGSTYLGIASGSGPCPRSPCWPSASSSRASSCTPSPPPVGRGARRRAHWFAALVSGGGLLLVGDGRRRVGRGTRRLGRRRPRRRRDAVVARAARPAAPLLARAPRAGARLRRCRAARRPRRGIVLVACARRRVHVARLGRRVALFARRTATGAASLRGDADARRRRVAARRGRDPGRARAHRGTDALHGRGAPLPDRRRLVHRLHRVQLAAPQRADVADRDVRVRQSRGRRPARLGLQQRGAEPPDARRGRGHRVRRRADRARAGLSRAPPRDAGPRCPSAPADGVPSSHEGVQPPLGEAARRRGIPGRRRAGAVAARVRRPAVRPGTGAGRRRARDHARDDRHAVPAAVRRAAARSVLPVPRGRRRRHLRRRARVPGDGCGHRRAAHAVPRGRHARPGVVGARRDRARPAGADPVPAGLPGSLRASAART